MYRYITAALTLAMITLASSVGAVGLDNFKVAQIKAPFAEVTSDVSDAIVNRGYKIDYHSFIGKMLQRTAKDVGSTKPLYTHAETYQFCSAVKSRTMMEADPRNIGYCPYIIFVYELEASPGTVHVGFRRPDLTGSPASQKALKEIDRLLSEIVDDVTG